VPQSKYDDLAATCALQKAESTAALDSMTSRVNSCKTQLDDCNDARKATETLISDQQEQIATLKDGSEVLAAARVKTDLIAQYKLVQTYFDDAYGPGKVPTTPKIKRLEALIISLKDTPVYGSWLDFNRCSIITECDAAKARLSTNINASINSLTYQVADIVANK
jgi:hypothetical protein